MAREGAWLSVAEVSLGQRNQTGWDSPSEGAWVMLEGGWPGGEGTDARLPAAGQKEIDGDGCNSKHF